MKLRLADEDTRMMLVGVRECYAYVKGVKGDQIGCTYSVILPSGEQLDIKNLKITPIVTREAVEQAMEAGAPLWVQATDLIIAPYVKDGRVAYSAIADKIEQVF